VVAANEAASLDGSRWLAESNAGKLIITVFSILYFSDVLLRASSEDRNMKILQIAALMTGAAMLCKAQEVDFFTAKDIAKMASALNPKGPISATKDLTRYKGHYFLLAKRVETGSSELHEHEADIFVVESGDAAIVTGGKISGGHRTAAGEIRGTSIAGGTRHELHAGDVVHIPAGVAHQVLVSKGKPFVYFVVKVTGQ
jgi:mannose-6-phosphate isomerase-like protein (cupin superfamily)